MRKRISLFLKWFPPVKKSNSFSVYSLGYFSNKSILTFLKEKTIILGDKVTFHAEKFDACFYYLAIYALFRLEKSFINYKFYQNTLVDKDFI